VAVEERGLTIVLSPAQLAAVLSHDTLSSDAAFTNRLWGAARTVGSIVELLGAGVLCALPEPTMASKAGCVVLGLHGADNFTAGTRQAWTGAETRSLTEQGASAAAQGLGAGKELGDDIGLAVDIAVPMAFASALGAARLAAVRAGRIRLAEHEAEIGSRIGGHTLAEHVGKTQAQLEARLALRDNRWMRVASSFKNRRLAEEAVSKAIRANEVAIKQWAATAKAGARQPFGAEIGKVIGHGVVKRTGKLVPMTRVRIVLKMETYKGLPYYILTAFPEL
jgi:hypothetical protein